MLAAVPYTITGPAMMNVFASMLVIKSSAYVK